MPVNTQRQAREIIYGMLLDGLDKGLYIKFQGLEQTSEPPVDAGFCAIYITYHHGGQYSLAGSTGKRHYNKTGTIVVQSFGPLSKNGFAESERLSQLVESCYRGKTGTGGIWFREIKSTPVGPTSAWYQHNTTITFEYSQYLG